MQIGHSKRAMSTPAAALIAEGWNALVQDGLVIEDLGTLDVLGTDSVVYATSDDGDNVGVLVYRFDAPRGLVWIMLVYVEPSSRRKGVFGEMMSALAAVCRKLSIDRVMFETHTDNKPMQAAMKSMEVPPVMVVYDLRIDPEPADD